MITEFDVTTGEPPKRLDIFLCHREPVMSRSGLQRLIELGRIRLNAQIVKPSQKIKPGDRITMDTPQPGPLLVNDEQVPLKILYEDDDQWFLCNLDGSHAELYADGFRGFAKPALSPDEKQIIFRKSGKDYDATQLFLFDFGKTNATGIEAPSGFIGTPMWR